MNNNFEIEGMRVKFLDLTAKEGLEISQSLMSAISFSESGDSRIDLGLFSKSSFDLIVKKMQVEVKNNNGAKEYKQVGSTEDLQLFFKNPLISFEITSCFFQYLSPFLTSISKLNSMKQNAISA